MSQLTAAAGDQGGREIIRNVATFLDERPRAKPFFVFVNLLEAHLPYDPPREYRDAHLSDLPPGLRIPLKLAFEYNAGLHPDAAVRWDVVRRLYGGDVNNADHHLGELVSLLERRGLRESTVIIVTSDHGEHLGEHGFMDHQFSVHETLLGVPLVIAAPPQLLPPGERCEPVMLTDVYATVLGAAGIEPDPALPQSRSLLAPAPVGAAARPLVAEYAGPPGEILGLLKSLNPNLDVSRLAVAWRTVREGDLRLTVGSDGTRLLHDLRADPLQQQDLAAARPRDVARLQEQLARIDVRNPRPAAGEAELDSLTRQRLRSLGYIR